MRQLFQHDAYNHNIHANNSVSLFKPSKVFGGREKQVVSEGKAHTQISLCDITVEGLPGLCLFFSLDAYTIKRDLRQRTAFVEYFIALCQLRRIYMYILSKVSNWKVH